MEESTPHSKKRKNQEFLAHVLGHLLQNRCVVKHQLSRTCLLGVFQSDRLASRVSMRLLMTMEMSTELAAHNSSVPHESRR